MADKGFELKGLKEILEALKGLESKEVDNIINAIQKKVLKDDVIDPVKAALPYSLKTKQAIKIVKDREDPLTLYAGVTSDAFWLRFVERGTRIRKGRGQIIAKPRAIPTIESKPEDIIEFFNSEFGEEVAEILRKKIKRMK